jgi:hypothetical protein
MAIAISPFAQIKIKLQIRIGLGNVDHMLKGLGMQGGPSQIGMNHNSRGIDDAANPGLYLKLNLPLDQGIEVFKGEDGVFDFRGVFVEEFLAESAQSFSDGVNHNRPGMNI